VAASLAGTAAAVEVVEAAAGKDAADHMAAGLGLRDFRVADGRDDADGNPEPGQPEATARAGELAAQLLDSDGLDAIPEPEPVIDGMLYGNSLAWLTGKRGCGKSFVALDMAGCVSAGLPWHGHVTRHGRVLYVAAEGATGLRQRVHAWEDRNGRSAVTFLPAAIRLPADAAPVAEIAVGFGASLVIIDTQARATIGLDENASKDMGLLVDALERIREASGACVLCVHHEPRNGEHPRGHSAIDGAATTLLRVAKDGPMVTVTNPKQKDAAEAEPLALALIGHLGSAVLGLIPPVGLGNFRTDSEETVRKTLLALVGLKGGATYTDLKTDCGLPASTFKYALNSLLSKGEVRNAGTKTRTRYLPVTEDEQLPVGPTEGQ
jgi:AAA domain